MKTILAVVPFLLMSQMASADAVADCRLVAKSKARLACYDKFDAKAPNAPPDKPVLANLYSAEDARTDARLKGICRGC
jgi:hypothetical protein